jgi:hypothetical protein
MVGSITESPSASGGRPPGLTTRSGWTTWRLPQYQGAAAAAGGNSAGRQQSADARAIREIVVAATPR